MERETDTLHLLQDHPMALFLVGAVLLSSILLFGAAMLYRREKRRRVSERGDRR
jgi:CBS-domain-containing membrane protein